MEYTKKAGCVFINIKTKKIGLVFRENYKDYSFPKGHLEENETLEECAIRETEEETKRKCKILEKDPIYIEHYTTPRGENVEMVYYLGCDNGKSNNPSEDTHPTFWYDYDEVYDKLSYDGLKKVWEAVKGKVKTYFDSAK